MAHLPVIVGFGGINAAGRSSLHHSYRRLVHESLSVTDRKAMLLSLASLTGRLRSTRGQWLDNENRPVALDASLTALEPELLAGTLIRKLENTLFDPQRLVYHRKATLGKRADQPVEFLLRKKDMQEQTPPGWTVIGIDEDKDGHVHVDVNDNFEVLLQCFREAEVNSAGQLPTGFNPESLYQARNHPRGLQLTVYGASDAVNSLGIDWQTVCDRVAPDQISVYAGSSMGQLDYDGFGGLMKARLIGKKVSSKQVALGFAEMPADFINAYMLGNLGTTGTNVAACATFLYNLRQGIRDIQGGTHRVVIVGTCEAPLVPEIFDGFATMGALANDAILRQLDGLDGATPPDYRRACRPFGNNAGFTLAESAQFIVLFDDSLAMELGANLYGAVNDVFVNADGYKKSITGPGLGNYLTLAKATSSTRNIIGEQGLAQRSYVQAHGTGTPQNRVTESQILSEIAGTFGIRDWPVAAIKSYVGHSLATAAGDQLIASLGIWKYGIIPGILTTHELATDVSTQNLNILLQHREVGAQGMDAAIINSKGFGGNNATASILAPHIVEKMLARKHGSKALSEYHKAREITQQNSADYDAAASAGQAEVIYRYDHNVLERQALNMTCHSMRIDGLEVPVDLRVRNNYQDMCE